MSCPDQIQKLVLTKRYGLSEGTYWVTGEALTGNQILMELLFEVFTTGTAPMSIVDGKKLGLGSLFSDVKSDVYSILVVVSGDALMGVNGVCLHQPILLAGRF